MKTITPELLKKHAYDVDESTGLIFVNAYQLCCCLLEKGEPIPDTSFELEQMIGIALKKSSDVIFNSTLLYFLHL